MAKKKKAKKRKNRSMDGKLVAKKQPHEVKYVAKKTKKSAKRVRAAIDKVGRSRKKVMAELTTA